MTEPFIEDRRASISKALEPCGSVVIRHSYQGGRLISIFSRRDDAHVIRDVVSRQVDMRAADGNLEYVDDDNGYFYGSRLKDDMEALGYPWVLTFQPGYDCYAFTGIWTVCELRAKKTGETAGAIIPDDCSHSIKMALDYFEEIVHQLVDWAGFREFREDDLYHVHDTAGNVLTDHPRVVQVATGEYVSHPLCCKCGSHTGLCCHFRSYRDAVRWADDQKQKCEKHRPKVSEKRMEELEEEYSDVENEDGDCCSCPLEAGA